jgi:hypothetical protein
MRYVILAPVALLIWAAILFPIASAIYGLLKWSGGWRLASAVPLAVLFLFFAPMAAQWIKDPSANNLWPLIFIPLTMVLSAYSGVVVLLHRKRVSLSDGSGVPPIPSGPR